MEFYTFLRFSVPCIAANVTISDFKSSHKPRKCHDFRGLWPYSPSVKLSRNHEKCRKSRKVSKFTKKWSKSGKISKNGQNRCTDEAFLSVLTVPFGPVKNHCLHHCPVPLLSVRGKPWKTRNLAILAILLKRCVKTLILAVWPESLLRWVVFSSFDNIGHNGHSGVLVVPQWCTQGGEIDVRKLLIRTPRAKCVVRDHLCQNRDFKKLRKVTDFTTFLENQEKQWFLHFFPLFSVLSFWS